MAGSHIRQYQQQLLRNSWHVKPDSLRVVNDKRREYVERIDYRHEQQHQHEFLKQLGQHRSLER